MPNIHRHEFHPKTSSHQLSAQLASINKLFDSNGQVGTTNHYLRGSATGEIVWSPLTGVPVAPVYVSARKNEDTVITIPANTTTYADINDMTIEFSSGSVYNASTGEFTAPRTAIYIIDYAININDDSPIFNEYLSAIVSVNRGSGFVREMRQIYTDSGKETKYITLKVVYMTQLNENDIVKSEVEMEQGGTATSTTIRGHSSQRRCTFQSIHSIT